MDKVKSVVISGLVVLGMGVEANASTSVSAAYGQCKAEVDALASTLMPKTTSPEITTALSLSMFHYSLINVTTV